MSGSTIGKNFTISTFGESHGLALGVIIDGCPAGLSLSKEDIMPFMNRRKPGQSLATTSRQEADEIEILSGVFEGKTTGTPIAMMLRNTSQISKDYSNIMNVYRPGHADYSFDAKYGIRDYRGGGRSSGRETSARVAAGAVAIKILKELGIEIISYTNAIGNVEISKYDENEIFNNNLFMPDSDAAKKANELIMKLREELNSVGGQVTVKIKGLKAGIGEPVFDKLDANLAKALFSIGAVKAVEIGEGVNASKLTGKENNDEFCIKEGEIHTKTNHAGGILGGISNGEDIDIKIHFKPTPSIASIQHTVNNSNEETDIEIKGRHDPTVVPRAVVVCEAMAAVTILDLLMDNMHSKLDNMKLIYNN